MSDRSDTRTDENDWTTGRPVVRNPAESTYIESQIIITTVRIVTVFSLTYGLFLMFHGADSPGGSFQGGAVMAATVLMIAFAFGIAPTRRWLRNRTVVALAAGGTAAFALVGLVPMLFGDSFLAHPRFKKALDIKTKWGLEAIEVGGVAPIVAGVLVGLFFVLAAGMFRDDGTGEPRADGGTSRSDPTPPGTAGSSADDTPVSAGTPSASAESDTQTADVERDTQTADVENDTQTADTVQGGNNR